MKHILVSNCKNCPRCFGKLTGNPWCAEISTNDETHWIGEKTFNADKHPRLCPLQDYPSDNADRYRVEELETAIREVLDEHADLADGENCTLIKLKKAIGEK